MKFGLTEEHYKILKAILIDRLKSHEAKVFVFGSRARGSHHPFSDIDIVFIENPKKTIPQNEILIIKENLEESSLPIKVDLVNFNDLAKSYLHSVEKDKIEV